MTRPALLLICAGMSAQALAQELSLWQVSDQSSLTFLALQQGAEFEGRFEQFDAQIQLDHNDLAQSGITITVATDSVNTAFDDRDKVLRSADFLNVEQWPEAFVRTSEIRDLGSGYFEAVGELKIRNQTQAIVAPFVFSRDGDKARLSGEIVISRLDFGVGQGEWTNTAWVGRDVTIRFDLELEATDASAIGP